MDSWSCRLPSSPSIAANTASRRSYWTSSDSFPPTNRRTNANPKISTPDASNTTMYGASACRCVTTTLSMTCRSTSGTAAVTSVPSSADPNARITLRRYTSTAPSSRFTHPRSLSPAGTGDGGTDVAPVGFGGDVCRTDVDASVLAVNLQGDGRTRPRRPAGRRPSMGDPLTVRPAALVHG
ncbi:hypothetical protein FAIPA1_610015 [Frankia sp. AiPs1]